MALYAIGDLHLSLNSNKSMEVFGPAWENYTERIRASLSQLTAEDVLVLAGDTSWGMSLEESVEDFRFLEQFPCKKYLIKGNHDYWWATAAKFRTFCEANGFTTLELLHNNCFFYSSSRVVKPLASAGETPIFCFLHYPPLYQGYQCPEILSMLEAYKVELCCYGHLHGPVIRRRQEGKYGNTEFSLISGDYLGFVPKKICEK